MKKDSCILDADNIVGKMDVPLVSRMTSGGKRKLCRINKNGTLDPVDRMPNAVCDIEILHACPHTSTLLLRNDTGVDRNLYLYNVKTGALYPNLYYGATDAIYNPKTHEYIIFHAQHRFGLAGKAAVVHGAVRVGHCPLPIKPAQFNAYDDTLRVAFIQSKPTPAMSPVAKIDVSSISAENRLNVNTVPGLDGGTDIFVNGELLIGGVGKLGALRPYLGGAILATYGIHTGKDIPPIETWQFYTTKLKRINFPGEKLGEHQAQLDNPREDVVHTFGDPEDKDDQVPGLYLTLRNSYNLQIVLPRNKYQNISPMRFVIAPGHEK